MNLKSIICDPHGEISQSKVWSNIAFATATFVVIKLAMNNSQYIGEVFLWYLVVVSGSELGKKFMTMRLSKDNITKE
ncbi:MAG: hypothetical protein DDT42_01295 [candidate division WS2 bacterium]|uniref:Uncharacterized protein n=1 Tax=Psychracetigena formicireducens TaxID=2986056 RepID=A0A9E2F1G4_PSYF1|nr:hypothetical protein [Candidatus Psychracetigena formicireducens]